MAVKNEEGHWLNARGKWIPAENVSKLDKMREAALDRMDLEIELLEAAMDEAKKNVHNHFKAYIEQLYKEHGAEKMAEQRNFTLTDFAGMRQAELKTADIKDFDERLIVAKELMDKCLLKWAGTNSNLKAIITEAFSVDKKGQFNRSAILGLTRIQLSEPDPDWAKACSLILESQTVRGSAEYVYFRRAESFGSKLKPVNLNYSHR